MMTPNLSEQNTRQCDELLHKAQQLAGVGRITEGLATLKQIIEIKPDHADACFGIAALSLNSGDMSQAGIWFKRAHELQPDDPLIPYNLALVMQSTGDKDQAIEYYRKAIELKPDFAQASNNLGNLFQREERLLDALVCYEQAIAADASLVEAHYNSALVLKKLKQPEAATEALQHTLTLKPDHAQALFTMGALLQDRKQYREAIPWYQKAISVDRMYIEAHSNLGLAYQHLDDYSAAIRQFLSAVELCNKNTDSRSHNKSQIDDFAIRAQDALYFNLGHLYKKLGNREAWANNFLAFENHHHNTIFYKQYGRDVALASGDLERAEFFLSKLVEHDYQHAELEQLIQVLSEIQYTDVSQKEIFQLYQQFNRLANIETAGMRVTPTAERTDGRRIRIGYLSPDFKKHVMGLLMTDVLAHHDRNRFELFCYSLGKREDATTTGFEELSDQFVRLRDMNAHAAAQRIADDKLDVLVDLAGLTDESNPMILAYKPAPLQLTHLGYHGSLGLDAVDYKITDRHADLPDNERYMTEALLAMEGCVMPFHHEDAAPDGPTRADLDISEDAIVFGEFINIAKLSPRCLNVWRRIIERLDQAILLFSPFLARDHDTFRLRTAAAGIPSDRIRFVPSDNDTAHGRARYRLLDLVLDTFPYSGGDTTMAALDMGVPVITLCGNRQSERMTYSILKHLGLEECIAHNETEFVDITCRLALEPHLRNEIATRIPLLLEQSGLSDIQRYTANFEQAVIQALRQKGLM